MIPGEVIVADEKLELNAERYRLKLLVVNTGDRPIQVGSHFHFAATNKALKFDRDAALGMRLNVIAGTSIRFEPGIEREIELVEIAGRKFIPGLNGQHPIPLEKK